jgi:hypothetical protein
VATITSLPRRLQVRITRSWIAGTRSAGSSAPRSPRATITASDSSAISCSASTADGFASLHTTPARPSISARASVTSAGRCTNDSAIPSAPGSSARSRSRQPLPLGQLHRSVGKRADTQLGSL